MSYRSSGAIHRRCAAAAAVEVAGAAGNGGAVAVDDGVVQRLASKI